jgi:hypothetical protein
MLDVTFETVGKPANSFPEMLAMKSRELKPKLSATASLSSTSALGSRIA